MHFPAAALLGGALIGLAASLFLLAHGRVAGISSLFGSVLRGEAEGRSLRLAFLAGLVAVGAAARWVWPAAFASAWVPPLPLALGAGVLVGFGTQLGSGCTSGHGVCGVARLSTRSWVATATFLVTGMVTVFVLRHLLGGGGAS